jgi:hypothetical protein
MRYVLLPVVLVAMAPFSGMAQGKSKPAPSPVEEIPRFTLDFGKPQETALSSNPVVMLANTACKVDGTLFIGISDGSSGASSIPFPSLHSLDPAGQVIRFETSHLMGYSDQSIYWAGVFFAGEHWVATLVTATLQDKETDKIASAPVQLALIYDSKGTFQRSVRLPDDIQISALGVYDSGELLIVGTGTNKLARLLVVDADGDVDRELRLFDDDYNSKQHAKEDQLLSDIEQNKAGALTDLQILPYGQNLLLFPSMTKQPVIEVNEHGIVRVYPLNIPKGFFLSSILSIGGRTWKIATVSNHIEPAKSADGSPPQAYALTNGPVFEFDPSSGAALRRIDPPKDAPGNSLVCEYDGQYTALTTDTKNGHLELLQANIPR